MLRLRRQRLGFGISHEPEKFIPDPAGFEQAWHAAPQALALMGPGDYERYAAQDFPMRLLARDTRRVIVAKP